MAEPVFIEDELERPFTGTLAWTADGRGTEVCVDAQAVRYGEPVQADKAIRERRARYGVTFKKVRCRCAGYHLVRSPS